jgi:uncharacterized membrane protein YccF (DUF307 family)
MRTLGNIIWHFLGFGFLNALFTFIVGGLFVITVVGAPIGLGLIQLSKMYLSPCSSAMVSKNDLRVEQNKYWKTFGIIVRIVYFPFGFFLCAVTVLQIVELFITLIGIPVALVLAKSMSTCFNPVGKVCALQADTDSTGKVNIRTFFSIGLFISFFLPWVDFHWENFSVFSLSGYDITLSRNLKNILEILFQDPNNTLVFSIMSPLLYLIPVIAAYNIFTDFTQSKKLIFLNEFSESSTKMTGTVTAQPHRKHFTRSFKGSFSVSFRIFPVNTVEKNGYRNNCR